MAIGALEEQPIGKCHVVGHDFVLGRLGAIAEPRIDDNLELFARRLQELKLPQHPKVSHVGNIVADGFSQLCSVKNLVSHGILLKLMDLNLSLRGGWAATTSAGKIGLRLQTRC